MQVIWKVVELDRSMIHGCHLLHLVCVCVCVCVCFLVCVFIFILYICCSSLVTCLPLHAKLLCACQCLSVCLSHSLPLMVTFLFFSLFLSTCHCDVYINDCHNVCTFSVVNHFYCLTVTALSCSDIVEAVSEDVCL